jgi:hypothetical protein
MAWASVPVPLLRGLGPRMDWTIERGFRPIPLWRGSSDLAKSA